MRTLFPAAVLALVWVQASQAAVEARTSHFRVVTELDLAVAYSAATYLEGARARFKALGLTPSDALPIQVVLFRDIAELESMAPRLGPHPGFTRGFFRPGADRDYIALAWDATGPPEVALAHEYAHHLFARTNYPVWFSEGVAEYLARVELRDDVLYLGGTAPGFLRSLQTEPWIPLPALLESPRSPEILGHRNFYAQCWLLVHWLVSSEGGLNRLKLHDLNRLADKLRQEGIEEKLRVYIEEPLPTFPVAEAPRHLIRVRIRELEAWEMSYWRADLLREMQQWERARSALREIQARYPGPPEPSESLGALEMDTGNYEEAEKALAAAVGKGSRNARTHYRYSLMLMAPAQGAGPERAQRAVEHARRARASNPGEPLYILTEAQALMLVEEWSESVRLLSILAARPDWRERAEAEFSELQRRRQQQLMQSRPPPEAVAAEYPPRLPFLEPVYGPVPKPPAPEPGPRERAGAARETWPPPGTVLFHGRVAGVECRGREKIITVDSGRLRVRVRERAGAPAKLYNPPIKWRTLPCGTRGWVVNVVYRPTSKDAAVSGDLVAVVF